MLDDEPAVVGAWTDRSTEGFSGMRKVYGTMFRKLIYPAYETGLRRRGTLAYLREYEKNQWLSAEEVAELQWRKLSRLIEHCWNEVPYYRKRWTEAGISGPADIHGPGDYARLPILTKQDVRENFEALKAVSYRGRRLYKTTGGSTGEPLKIGYTRESYERRNAVMHRGYAWAGAPLGTRALYFWGETPGDASLKKWMMHAAFNRRVVDVFTMRDDDLGRYVDAIDEYRPEVVVSYVAPIVRIAGWMLRTGRRAHVPNAVLCAAEPLHRHQREAIEAAFGCPVFDTYGCREVMLIGSECEMRDGLHVNADHLCVELGETFVQGDGRERREVLLTDLHNYGMPLMRYANGDLATARQGACRCGRGLPMLASVDGRSMDALRTPEGHFVGEYLENLVFNTPGIHRFQAVQDRVDRLEVSLVRGEGFDEASLEEMRGAMRQAFGDSLTLDFRFTDEIPLTPTGKLRVAISRLTTAALAPLFHVAGWLECGWSWGTYATALA